MHTWIDFLFGNFGEVDSGDVVVSVVSVVRGEVEAVVVVSVMIVPIIIIQEAGFSLLVSGYWLYFQL